MGRRLRELVLGSLIALALALAAGAALYACATAEFTVCYGIFKSKAAAERAADAGRDAWFSVDVDHRETESAVEFDTGETGNDAEDARRAFRKILRSERGISGHGRSGCLERTAFQ